MYDTTELILYHASQSYILFIMVKLIQKISALIWIINIYSYIIHPHHCTYIKFIDYGKAVIFLPLQNVRTKVECALSETILKHIPD